VARALDAPALARSSSAWPASESRHSGEIRLCVEAGLPLSYLWRAPSARERAVTMFGKLRVWDTEHNNGVLIYLLLAEHAIEIVADRGLARTCRRRNGTPWWPACAAFRGGRFEEGLAQAIDAVHALLLQHFAAGPGPGQIPTNCPIAQTCADRHQRGLGGPLKLSLKGS
jgi:hypothetical protein